MRGATHRQHTGVQSLTDGTSTRVHAPAAAQPPHPGSQRRRQSAEGCPRCSSAHPRGHGLPAAAAVTWGILAALTCWPPLRMHHRPLAWQRRATHSMQIQVLMDWMIGCTWGLAAGGSWRGDCELKGTMSQGPKEESSPRCPAPACPTTHQLAQPRQPTERSDVEGRIAGGVHARPCIRTKLKHEPDDFRGGAFGGKAPV